jgi:hypothetical protein
MQTVNSNRPITRSITPPGSSRAVKRSIAVLLSQLPLNHVSRDYVIERLLSELIRRNPEVLDYLNELNGAPGKGTVRLINAVLDWRDDPGAR